MLQTGPWGAIFFVPWELRCRGDISVMKAFSNSSLPDKLSYPQTRPLYRLCMLLQVPANRCHWWMLHVCSTGAPTQARSPNTVLSTQITPLTSWFLTNGSGGMDSLILKVSFLFLKCLQFSPLQCLKWGSDPPKDSPDVLPHPEMKYMMPWIFLLISVSWFSSTTKLKWHQSVNSSKMGFYFTERQ